MNPWLLLDRADVPGGDELRLLRRGDDFSIMSGRIELMNSRQSGSEETLAGLACERIAGRRAPHILIGGLGMGFTLNAARDALGKDANITVAELVPAVVAWARGPLAELFKGALDDPRVTIHVGDVAPLIASGRAAYDAILLDVDNGPDGLTRAANDALYHHSGLGAARAALRPNGALAVWSSARDRDFTARLRMAGFAVEEIAVRARAGKGARHTIWLATKADQQSSKGSRQAMGRSRERNRR